MKPFTGSNEGKTLNVTLSSALRHETEIVSVPHMRLCNDVALVHLKIKRKSCLYNPGCFGSLLEFKCVSLAEFFMIARMHVCVCIPGSDYSYLKYCVVLDAIVLSVMQLY